MPNVLPITKSSSVGGSIGASVPVRAIKAQEEYPRSHRDSFRTEQIVRKQQRHGHNACRDSNQLLRQICDEIDRFLESLIHRFGPQQNG
ncbi:hypothetical protein BDD14_1326 [Edaphobacter modestus]|uniref:Uncharacterized protein n=1 Tax=Edaphobacter modestus TaxID=388466 RepID=A0A4Q7YQ80_9BACT|nr:hypothetical protein BDD14_1326 [Edaphobacter modestus]